MYMERLRGGEYVMLTKRLKMRRGRPTRIDFIIVDAKIHCDVDVDS